MIYLLDTSYLISSTDRFMKSGCVFVCLLAKPFNEQQHPPDAGGPVHQTHQEAELHGGEGGLDGSLHQQGQSGEADRPATPAEERRPK